MFSLMLASGSRRFGSGRRDLRRAMVDLSGCGMERQNGGPRMGWVRLRRNGVRAEAAKTRHGPRRGGGYLRSPRPSLHGSTRYGSGLGCRTRRDSAPDPHRVSEGWRHLLQGVVRVSGGHRLHAERVRRARAHRGHPERHRRPAARPPRALFFWSAAVPWPTVAAFGFTVANAPLL